MKIIFNDPTFSSQLLRTIGETYYKGADAYLRASNYYRAAEFLLIDPHDPRIQTTWGNNKECFSKAAKLFPFLVESIEIVSCSY